MVLHVAGTWQPASQPVVNEMFFKKMRNVDGWATSICLIPSAEKSSFGDTTFRTGDTKAIGELNNNNVRVRQAFVE